MSDTDYMVWADGGARGNPGPAAYGFVLHGPGIGRVEHGKTIGRATNNVAEYTAVIEALKKLKALIGSGKAKAARVAVNADSELLVRQMNGQYKVKDADLKLLFMELHNVMLDFGPVTFAHVRREQNRDADRMVNQALDGEQGELGL